MSQIDTYRSSIARKRADLVKLNQELAREQAKIALLQKKIISAQSTIKNTKSQSTIKSRFSEIERSNKSIADIQTKIGNIIKKIAQKEKELATAEKNYRSEEARLNKRESETEKKRQQDIKRQTSAMELKIKQHERIQNEMQNEIERLKAIPEKITVLFLAANPIDTKPLRLDEEVHLIQEKIRLSEHRDSVTFVSRWATRSSDILQVINESNPTVVHFSGHGTQSGELALQNPDGSTKLVTIEAISKAMSTASDTIRLVVFNACFSELQAVAVTEDIEAAIGMSDSILDKAARVFAAQLYSSIGFGRSLQNAFNQAVAELMLEGIPGDDIPRLYARDDVNLDDITLVRPDI
jgi:hypothetical protein